MPDIEDTTTATVCFSKSNVTVKWPSNPKPRYSLLKLAEESGLKPRYGCRMGVCGSCEAKLVTGQVYGIPGERDTDRGILICSSVPATQEIVLDI